MNCACKGDGNGVGFEPCGLHATRLREARREARRLTLAEVRQVVEAEEEMPGDMPKNLNTALAFGPREVREELLRLIVKRTKANILARLAEREGVVQ